MEKSYPIGRAMGTYSTVLPNGGTTGQVLAKKSNADLDVQWSDKLPNGGLTGQVLGKKTEENQDAEWMNRFPDGGVIGQVLAKKSNTNQDVEWKSIDVTITKDVIAQALGITTAQLDELSKLSSLLSVNDEVTIYNRVNAASYNVFALDNLSWEQINALCQAGLADKCFSIGDTKTITLKNNNGVVPVAILDFNKDVLSDGSGNAAISFGLRKLTSYGSRGTINDCFGFEELLPDDLLQFVKTVNKDTFDVNSNKIVKATKTFRFSATEMNFSSSIIENSTYAYYALPSTTKAMIGSSTFNEYYLRTPAKASNANYSRCLVDESGQITTTTAVGSSRSNNFGFCL